MIHRLRCAGRAQCARRRYSWPVGISEAGQREILGLEIALGETGEAWRRFIQRLKGRGLSGVVAQKFLRMATSDAHEGLRRALEAAFPGLIWQRCHTEEFLGVHFRRNVLSLLRDSVGTTRGESPLLLLRECFRICWGMNPPSLEQIDDSGFNYHVAPITKGDTICTGDFNRHGYRRACGNLSFGL